MECGEGGEVGRQEWDRVYKGNRNSDRSRSNLGGCRDRDPAGATIRCLAIPSAATSQPMAPCSSSLPSFPGSKHVIHFSYCYSRVDPSARDPHISVHNIPFSGVTASCALRIDPSVCAWLVPVRSVRFRPLPPWCHPRNNLGVHVCGHKSTSAHITQGHASCGGDPPV